MSLQQLPDLLLHRTSPASSERLERADDFGGYVPNGQGGHICSSASTMLAFSRAGEQALPPTVASAIMVRRGGTRTRQYGVDGLDQTFDQQIVQNYDTCTF